MNTQDNPTILCLATYFKGEEFLRECARREWRVLLLTEEKLAAKPWPRESIEEVLLMPDLSREADVIHAVSYLVRSREIARIVPIDEFDMETAAALREHLRIPGMGQTTARHFRDKLAMRVRAHERGIAVPDFVPLFHHDTVREFMQRVPGPWLLKPRSSAATIGIHLLREADELWPLLEALGDRQSFHLLERFVPGDIFHVDSIVSERVTVFAVVSAYGQPPMSVSHEGGVFMTRTVERGGPEDVTLQAVTRELAGVLGMVRGVMHTEFIRGENDGRCYFLETAARVAGAHIADVVAAATGIDLWKEWARIETSSPASAYRLPDVRSGYAGSVISLARQEFPDTSTYDDPEIVWRLDKEHHAGLIVASSDPARVRSLLTSYARRFKEDFVAKLPPPEKPSA
ncbi:MAG: ATPase [Gemmatimonadetes bacterium]|nr:ATPase [Gemmatimonadota bacterium]